MDNRQRHDIHHPDDAEGRAFAEHDRACDPTCSQRDREREYQTTLNAKTLSEGQRAGADDHHREHTEHTIHEHRGGGLGQMHIVPRERVSAVHVSGDAGDKIADE